jgi:hypothetical protein
MNKLFKEIFEGFEKAQNIARQISKANDPKETEEEIEYTCCNVEITQEIKDIGLCPSCLEHI